MTDALRSRLVRVTQKAVGDKYGFVMTAAAAEAVVAALLQELQEQGVILTEFVSGMDTNSTVRTLGVAERGSVWRDRNGDTWRWVERPGGFWCWSGKGLGGDVLDEPGEPTEFDGPFTSVSPNPEEQK